MDVLLISANTEKLPDPVYPLGAAYVADAARRAGHHVEAVDSLQRLLARQINGPLCGLPPP